MEKKNRIKKEKISPIRSIFDIQDVSPSKKRKLNSVHKGNEDSEIECCLALSDTSNSEDSDCEDKINQTSVRESVTHSRPLVDDSSLESDVNEHQPTEYYDFSAIINSQAEITKYQSELKDTETTLETEKPLQQTKPKKKLPNTHNTKKSVKKRSSSTNNHESETLNVSELLAIGENCDEYKPISNSCSNLTDKSINPEKTVEVKIHLPTFNSKKNKRYDIEAALKRRLNSVRKENQVFFHKVHILCLIAHGNYVNSVLNNEELLGCALSIIPSENFYPPKQASIEYLEKLVAWFSKKIQFDERESREDSLITNLVLHFQERCCDSIKKKVLMFICIARVLGLKCRFMMSLQPMPLKPPRDIGEKKVSVNKAEEYDSEVSSDEDLTEVLEKKYFAKDSSDYFNATTSTENPPKKGKKNIKIDSKLNVGVKKTNASSKLKSKIDRRVLSTDSEEGDTTKKKKKGNDFWAEVFVECEEKWISVDIHRGKVHCIDQIYASCTHPVTYVLGWNNDYSIKDLTRRYCPTWLTTTRKLRVENSWWDETLKSWTPKKTAIEKEEDHELDRMLEEKPLPTSIAEYKSHPLYVLKRHLLKFEAIYPPDARPIGFVKKEPIYSRLCVAQLHSKETWMREAKLVRLNEKPYKIVKARPKYDKLTGNTIKDLPLEVFGYWQVEDYIPPVATDGKVPRNDYGNVELYKQSMLPIGTVHLQIPGLMRVARKLGIDCAPAVVGWEYSGCSSHPVFDGFVICEEFKDKILDFWNKEIDETAKKEKLKNEQRIYKNWRRLIKGLIIRERLEKRYNFGSSVITEDKKKPVKKRK